MEVQTTEQAIENMTENEVKNTVEGTKDNVKNAEKKRDRTLLGSTAMKILLFFLLVISYVAAAVFTVMALYLWDCDAYDGREYEFVRSMMSQQIWSDYYGISSINLDLNDMDQVERILNNEDVRVRLVCVESREEIWSNYDGFSTPYTYQIYMTYSSDPENWGYGVLRKGAYYGAEMQDYVWEFYIDPTFPDKSEYWQMAQTAQSLYNSRYAILGAAVGSLLILSLFFILLMCSAGHHNGKKGITPSMINFMPIDLYAAIWLFAAYEGVYIAVFYCNDIWSACVSATAFGTLEILWGTVFAMEVMTRLKLGEFWKNTVIYKAIRLFRRICRSVARGAIAAMNGLPGIVDNLIIFFGICILEFIGILFWGEVEVFLLWCLEKLILLLIVVYFSLCQAKLEEAEEALAEGNLNYKLDTSKMILAQKRQGENLNSIAQGINAAVEERMKSERLKTELITNVSHDIKTPLTSIINYSDLIVNESADHTKISEYAEVLGRQSMRLKKLLDDLLEASKAATGNLDVNLQPCEVGVMLTQTIGEYEHRFEEKGLKLVTRQPETAVRIQADSRHMWRIFDNLMGNICKYAMEDSRVYLTVERLEDAVNIVFRNMSKYELNVSSDELTERFSRGDGSRHMEGNGLGLSIAASLVELQNGRMKIVTDGDLFKVTLTFPMLAEE